MRAGRLDRRIVIEQPVYAQGADGQAVKTWLFFAEVCAEKRDTAGREFIAADRETAALTTTFRLRWLSGVSREMRISYGGALFDIQHIAEIGRREGLEIVATAQVT
jgi:SPP1 family predicted phage head-tail adaptor